MSGEVGTFGVNVLARVQSEKDADTEIKQKRDRSLVA